MLSKPTDLLLPGRCESMARIQRSKGWIALTDTERDDLASCCDESVVNQFSEDVEIVRLLARSFSRGENIPEYYRYASLHAYDWFLAHCKDDPVCASIIAMRATLVNLVAHERTEAHRHDAAPGYIEERLARLGRLLDQIDTMVLNPAGTVRGRDLADLAERDAALRWKLFLVYGYDPRKTEVFNRFSHLQELNDPPFRYYRSLREVILGVSGPKLTAAFAKVERILLTWRPGTVEREVIPFRDTLTSCSE